MRVLLSVGHDACAHNLLQKGHPLIMRLRQQCIFMSSHCLVCSKIAKIAVRCSVLQTPLDISRKMCLSRSLQTDGSEFLLFLSRGVVGFLPHSTALPVNKPDERAGGSLASSGSGEQSEVLEAGIMLRRVGGSDMLRSARVFRPIGLQSIEERERLR
jgi:hypothetical protein